jgi:hypothetical protein
MSTINQTKTKKHARATVMALAEAHAPDPGTAALRSRSPRAWLTRAHTHTHTEALAEGELCSQCGVTTRGDVAYTVQGMLVHDQCFRCADCARVLSLTSFLWAGNYLYCREHYAARFARACAACGELALDAMLWKDGNFFHAGCLECARCGRALWPGHFLDRTSTYVSPPTPTQPRPL